MTFISSSTAVTELVMSVAVGDFTPSRTSSRKLGSTTARSSCDPPPLAIEIDVPELGCPSGVIRRK